MTDPPSDSPGGSGDLPGEGASLELAARLESLLDRAGALAAELDRRLADDDATDPALCDETARVRADLVELTGVPPEEVVEATLARTAEAIQRAESLLARWSESASLPEQSPSQTPAGPADGQSSGAPPHIAPEADHLDAPVADWDPGEIPPGDGSPEQGFQEVPPEGVDTGLPPLEVPADLGDAGTGGVSDDAAAESPPSVPPGEPDLRGGGTDASRAAGEPDPAGAGMHAPREADEAVVGDISIAAASEAAETAEQPASEGEAAGGTGPADEPGFGEAETGPAVAPGAADPSAATRAADDPLDAAAEPEEIDDEEIEAGLGLLEPGLLERWLDRVLSAIDRPFENLNPAVKEVIGYAGIAIGLLSISMWVIIFTLLRP